MSRQEIRGPEPFWRTVRLLWKAARRRARGRQERQRNLLRNRKGRASNPLGAFAIVLTALFMGVVHGLLGYITAESVTTASMAATEREGRMIVSDNFFRNLKQLRSGSRAFH